MALEEEVLVVIGVFDGLDVDVLADLGELLFVADQGEGVGVKGAGFADAVGIGESSGEHWGVNNNKDVEWRIR